MPTPRQKKYIAGGAIVAVLAGVWYYLNQPSIVLVDSTLSVSSGYAVWAASGMNPSHVYVIGTVLPNGSLFYNPDNDTRVNSSSADGVYNLDSNMIGATLFVLYDQTASAIAASTPCTVSA